MKIKNLLCAALAAAMTMSTASAFAATEDPVQFSTVDEMNGRVYVAQYSDSQQGGYFRGADITIESIPRPALKFSSTQFCCYGNRFYYMDNDFWSGPSKIYSCDANGYDEILIADNASSGTAAFIVDNNLYYTAYSSMWDWDYGLYDREYYGGIYKINLATGDWQRVVSDNNALMRFCDGDYIYYEILYTSRSNDFSDYYKIDTNGNYCSYANYYDDEFAYNSYSYNLLSYMLTGQKIYFIDNTNTLYSRTRNGGDLKQLKKIESGSFGSDIVKVTKKHIYYITQWWGDSFVWLYRTDRN